MTYSTETIQVELEEWTRVSFPSGDRLLYVEVPSLPEARNHHTYWRAKDDWSRGKQLAGASSMVCTFDLKQDGLHRWIGREAAASGDSDPGKDKRELGTRVHGVFEHLALGKPFPSLAELPLSDSGYVRGLLKWWERRRPEVVACEQFVFHAELGYAGRLDLRCIIDGKTTIVDLKTSKGLYPKYGAQLVAYDLASEACGLGLADRLFILKVNELGEFYEVPAYITRSELLAALDTRKVAGRVGRQQQEALRAAA